MKNATMKIALLFLMLPLMAVSQVWLTSDSIGVRMKGYGELEFYSHSVPRDSVKQIDRITLMVGTDTSAVFDYNEDADEDVEAMLVSNPVLSDMEGFASINNYYSLEPPDIFAEISTYSWNATEFILVKMVVTNTADTAIDARISLDIIPQIDGDYDGVNTWIPDGEFLDMTRDGSNHFGLKFLSHPMTSLKQFVWFSGYTDSDVDLYNWINYGLFDTTMVCTNPADGIVSIPSTDPINMQPSIGTTFYYAVARGTTLEALKTNLAAAQVKYTTLPVGVVDSNVRPEGYALSQNYPNPFNPSSTIAYSLPVAGNVSIKVFNLRGELVESLYQGWKDAGSHTQIINGTNLPSGIYVYSLSTTGIQLNRKMILLK